MDYEQIKNTAQVVPTNEGAYMESYRGSLRTSTRMGSKIWRRLRRGMVSMAGWCTGIHVGGLRRTGLCGFPALSCHARDKKGYVKVLFSLKGLSHHLLHSRLSVPVSFASISLLSGVYVLGIRIPVVVAVVLGIIFFITSCTGFVQMIRDAEEFENKKNKFF